MNIVLLVKFIYVTDPNESKYQYLIGKRKNTGCKWLKDVYKNIEVFTPGRKCNVLIFFDDMIAVMISNKKLSPIVTEVLVFL